MDKMIFNSIPRWFLWGYSHKTTKSPFNFSPVQGPSCSFLSCRNLALFNYLKIFSRCSFIVFFLFYICAGVYYFSSNLSIHFMRTLLFLLIRTDLKLFSWSRTAHPLRRYRTPSKFRYVLQNSSLGLTHLKCRKSNIV